MLYKRHFCVTVAASSAKNHANRVSIPGRQRAAVGVLRKANYMATEEGQSTEDKINKAKNAIEEWIKHLGLMLLEP